MGRRPSLIAASIARLQQKMAIGTSRQAAKQQARLAGEARWPFSTGTIHSYRTRTVYQQQSLAFVSWARTTYGVRRLEDLDAHADRLATLYLTERQEAGWSASTLLTARSALRLFFSMPTLAHTVAIAPRTRQAITRSRQPVAQDADFQPAHWQPLIAFLRATGLRRSEVERVLVEDVSSNAEGQLTVLVRRGKGGLSRQVPVLAGEETQVLALQKGRSGTERLFPQAPSHLDIHALRRAYAQALYCSLSGRDLPPTEKRLTPADYDAQAARRVALALGHRRLDVIFKHYLR